MLIACDRRVFFLVLLIGLNFAQQPVLAASPNLGDKQALQIDLDADCRTETAYVEQEAGEFRVQFRSSRSNQDAAVALQVDDFCGPSTLYATRKRDEVAVDSSCSGQGAQVSVRLYRTGGPVGQWCLGREVSGERASVHALPFPRYTVRRFSACAPADKDLLELVRHALADSAVRPALLQQFDEFDAAELAARVDKTNLAVLNDWGFYLEQTNNATAAAILLATVVEHAPERVVAKLNYADALWRLQAENQAQAMYRQYQQQMATKGLAKKVPARVKQRLNLSGKLK